MDIIGIGKGGCALATHFIQYKQYKKIFRIDTETLSKNERCFDLLLPSELIPEDYEKNIPNLKKYFKSIDKEVLFIVVGGGSISLASLSILSQIKDKCSIQILYVQPEKDFLGHEQLLKEKLVFNVFQEYTRSGLFERMYICSNILIDDLVGGLPVLSFFDSLNKIITSSFNYINSFSNMKAVSSTISRLPEATRISTIGVVDPETFTESMFFNLDGITDSVYYFGYNDELLNTDKSLLKNVKDFVKSKINDENKRVSYGIFATNYEQVIIYCTKHTSIIQN